MNFPFLPLIAAISYPLIVAEPVNFDKEDPGAFPAHWVGVQTGAGSAKWSVENADDAPSKPNVLKQSGEGPFPFCYKEDPAVENGFASVKFKLVSGTTDQAGGLVWRYQGENTCYFARASALENKVTIYHSIGGKQVAFKSVNTKVAAGVWHTLRVEFNGDQFIVLFDGQRVIEATDESIPGPGKVGVCTKADSVTLFDDFISAGKRDDVE